MSVNGESVYGTEKWIVNHEGPTVSSTEGTRNNGYNPNFSPKDFWFTKKGNNIYVTSLKWPDKNEIMIESLVRLSKDGVSKIESVEMLGCDDKVTWAMEEKGLKVILPSKLPNPYGYVLKVISKNK
jgi:alpha-L-fucosidase